jgi:hypothetical protein
MKTKLLVLVLVLMALFGICNHQMLFFHHSPQAWAAATVTQWNGITLGHGAGSVNAVNGKDLGPGTNLNGIALRPNSVTASTTEMVFPTTQTLSTSVSMTMTITNAGPWIIAPTTSVVGTTWFGATMAEGIQLPGGTRTAVGTFTPLDTTARSGTLYINW